MSKKDVIEELFKNLNANFDVNEPELEHEKRFLAKLKASSNSVVFETPKSKRYKWQQPLAIAASLLLMVVLGFNAVSSSKHTSVAKVPEKMQNAQYHFASLIEVELEKINKQVTPDTKKIVEDAMLQLKKLEADYKKIEENLLKNGNTKQLLHAMITNFQMRIDLLQNVLIKIENVKSIKYEFTSV